MLPIDVSKVQTLVTDRKKHVALLYRMSARALASSYVTRKVSSRQEENNFARYLLHGQLGINSHKTLLHSLV